MDRIRRQASTETQCMSRLRAPLATESLLSTSSSEAAREGEQEPPQGRSRRLNGGRRLRRKEKGSWNDIDFVQTVMNGSSIDLPFS